MHFKYRKVKMRKLSELTSQDIDKINSLLKKEYYYSMTIYSWEDVLYQVFSKSHSVYSGFGVVAVYDYLKSSNIDIFDS